MVDISQLFNTRPTQLINVGFGRETFSKDSASLAAFIVENGFERNLPSKKFSRQGKLQRFPASQYPDVNGYMFLDSVTVPDGEVLMLQASHRRNSLPYADGSVCVRLRSTGPLLVIYASLPSNSEATLTGEFIAFHGRGDILAVRDLAGYGIKPPRKYVSAYFNEDEVRECFRVHVAAPETEAAPKLEQVKMADGKVELAMAKPSRKLRLHKP